jgi:arsenite methyltransferase
VIARLRHGISRQLSRPSGRFGRLVAFVMNRGNRRINVRAVELLQPRRDERVLDLGFGGGLGLDLLLDRTDHVVGVDRAGDMVAAARAARADAVASGRLTLLEGDVSAPPLADDSVDGIVTVNTVYFWPDLPTAFSECVACSPRTAAW